MTQPRRCDPDDIVCQMEILRHIRGLETQLGNEVFLEKFPELGNLRERLPAAIIEQRKILNDSIDGCVEGDTVEEQLESRADARDRALDVIEETESREDEEDDE